MSATKSVSLTYDSLVSAKIELLFGSEVLAGGTAFFYEKDGHKFLLTNCHNVTGREPVTRKIISKSAATPDKLVIKIPGISEEGILRFCELEMDLYRDDERRVPLWWVHPVHAEKVDLAVIPLAMNLLAELSGEIRIVAANEPLVNNLDVPLRVGQDVFTIGFPRMMDAGGLPIWKRGSLATHPGQTLGGLPKLYIDTATREGMSGSPVFASGIISVRIPGQQISGLAIRNRFLGIYSGRVGDDTFQAQLGVVWKESAIVETINGRTTGISSF